MKLRFDDNDDLVIDDIPDDLVHLAEKLAFERKLSLEDIWRDVITQFINRDRREEPWNA